MKLISHVTLRLSVAVTLILSVWAVLFYVAMIDEINDEVDDSLEDYSETIIIRVLSGEQFPSKDNGSNNQYYLVRVDGHYAMTHPSIEYADEMVYIEEKRETEPARILRTIFENEAGEYFQLVVMTPTIEKRDVIHSILIWTSLLYATLLVIIIVLNIYVFYRSMQPLYRLLDWFRHYRVGQKNEPLPNRNTITEFRTLYDAANLYAARNEQLFEQQKRFIGNASHELQTPLAICRNRLEMLMEDEDITERHLEELAKTHQTLEHITKLNKSLLLLSKIENEQFADVRPVCFNHIVRRYLDDYCEVYEYRDIAVSVREEARLTFVLNETLAVTLVTNLLKNAFVHNTDGGRLVITLTADTFCISNTGVRHPLDRTKIFERFYKGSKQEGSTGLGLSIVAGICKLSGLEVHYEYRDEMHHFSIRQQKKP